MLQRPLGQKDINSMTQMRCNEWTLEPIHVSLGLKAVYLQLEFLKKALSFGCAASFGGA